MRIFFPILFAVLLIMFSGCSRNQKKSDLSTEITESDLSAHISYLASDDLGGRETGTAGEAKAASYIAKHFEQFGLMPGGNEETYFQEFTVNMSVLNNQHGQDTGTFADEERIARNVIGVVEGNPDSNSYIVLGAHYDHLGTGKFGSLFTHNDTTIHNGADDNASGIAGLLELAQYFSKNPIQKNLLFIGFSGEEMGLLGSQYFVENPTIPLDELMAMINMDMIGRLTNDKLLVFGTGSSDGWQQLFESITVDSLSIETIPDGIGASDHTSFYNKKKPALHYFTDTHSDYHRPSDDIGYINSEGEDKILEHVKSMILSMDDLSAEELTYTEAPVTQNRNVILEGVIIGVIPDYGFTGEGLRITGVQGGGPADRAGLKGGDIIVKLADKNLKDIYTYMNVLNELKEGQKTTITVLRKGVEQTLDITL